MIINYSESTRHFTTPSRNLNITTSHLKTIDYGWSPRQNSFSTTNLLASGSSQLLPTEYVYPGSSSITSEEDNIVAAGHNHGWGWGQGHG